jgi:colanic acid biosynthesis glycosyl transferase WcaI
MPSKLGPMLASGKPIVAQAEADCEVALAIKAKGVVVPYSDTVAMAAAVVGIYKATRDEP